jgi:hypothetical protein
LSRSLLDKNALITTGAPTVGPPTSQTGQASEPVERTGAQAPLRGIPINNLIILDGAE